MGWVVALALAKTNERHMTVDPLRERILATVPLAATLREAIVLRVEGDGTIITSGVEDGEVLCELLFTGSMVPITPAPRDRVLVWQADPTTMRGVVLGRVGSGHSTDTPEALLVQASQELTLRVGEGSITIRKDGKILIKGKDLVSHAQRMNRIKGGSVSIN